MFRNDLGNVSLSGAPGPSFRPAVEALEQRLVLDSGESLAPSDHLSDPVNNQMVQVALFSQQIAQKMLGGGSLKRIASLLKAEKLLESQVAFLEATAPRDEHGDFTDPAFATADSLFHALDGVVLHDAFVRTSTKNVAKIEQGVLGDRGAFDQALVASRENPVTQTIGLGFIN
jgi:hypothetical protein